MLTEVVALVPDEWLDREDGIDDLRAAYVDTLFARASTVETWLPAVAA
jgi:hypothetical protein